MWLLGRCHFLTGCVLFWEMDPVFFGQERVNPLCYGREKIKPVYVVPVSTGSQQITSVPNQTSRHYKTQSRHVPILTRPQKTLFYSRASSVKFHSSKNNEGPASSFPDLLASCRVVLVMRIQLRLSLVMSPGLSPWLPAVSRRARLSRPVFLVGRLLPAPFQFGAGRLFRT